MDDPVRYRVTLDHEVQSHASALAFKDRAEKGGGRASITPVYLMRWEQELDEDGDDIGKWVCGKCGADDLQSVDYVSHWWNKAEAEDTPKRIAFHGEFDWGDDGIDPHIACLSCGARNDEPTDVEMEYL